MRNKLSKSLFSRITFVFILLSSNYTCFGITMCSWNIQNMGQSKSTAEIDFMAKILNDFDVVAIQEVSTGPAGALSVSYLGDALNRKGSKWDYTVSDVTSGTSYKSERYAFLWKTSKVQKVGKAWLEAKYAAEIDREPFYCTFKSEGKLFTIANFHAITKSKQPETEIKYFKFLPAQYPDLNLIFCGDFNCPQTHTVFNPLKTMGYKSALTNQKTSLKQKCETGNCLASEYDNIFYKESAVAIIKSGVVLFFEHFVDFAEAKKISDHVPIFMEFSLR